MCSFPVPILCSFASQLCALTIPQARIPAAGQYLAFPWSLERPWSSGADLVVGEHIMLDSVHGGDEALNELGVGGGGGRAGGGSAELDGVQYGVLNMLV